jgi:uncharacterized peroxidase-related enzyme
MPWIQQIPIDQATGLLKRLFDDTLQRAGRIWNIVHIMSLNPPALRDSIRFYVTLMHEESGISRVQRELLATVVSGELHCRYWLQSHAHDLREEVEDQFEDPSKADAFVESVARDWRTASLSPADRALCEFAIKVTRRQNKMSPNDLDRLRSHGFEDTAIHDAVQVIGYFNYITRVADALGVEPETFIRPWGKDTDADR